MRLPILIKCRVCYGHCLGELPPCKN